MPDLPQLRVNEILSEDRQAPELQKALSRISRLEEKLKVIEIKAPKKYADVVFLNYKDRKRIMVSVIYFPIFIYIYHNLFI